jgi:hypothetical protein
MTPLSAARRRGRGRTPALILTSCLLTAACGSGAAGLDHRPGAVAGGSAVADRCAAQVGPDPSRMILCLSAHHVAIPDGFGFRACADGAHDAAGAVDCMRRLAR